MKKNKGVNFIAIIAIVIALTVIGLILFFAVRPSNDANNNGGRGGEDLGQSVLSLESIEQFRKFAETDHYECYIGEDMSGGSIYKVPLLGEQTVVTYYFDSHGNTTDFQAFYYLNADITDKENMNIEEMTTEKLAEAARETIEKFCLLFDCSSDVDLYLSNSDGSFTLIENDDSFQAIADGNSKLVFSIRAKDGYFWELTISAVEKLVSANICKYFNIEESMSYVANISLYEEE